MNVENECDGGHRSSHSGPLVDCGRQNGGKGYHSRDPRQLPAHGPVVMICLAFLLAISGWRTTRQLRLRARPWHARSDDEDTRKWRT